MGSRREFRFHEGCLDHKWKGANNKQTSYRKLWMVMKGNVIYIFRDRPFIPENHEGTLTIDGNTKFDVQKEKPQNYKFLLSTGNRRVNLFKSDKKSERDLWRGYIIGVAKQKVPDDLDLPRDIINKIKQDVGNYHLEKGTGFPDPTSGHGNPSVTGSSPRHSVSSGSGRFNRKSIVSNDSGVISQRSPSSGSGSMTIDGTGGGPFMRHKFSNNPDDSYVPSWFFEACTREKAEIYLAIAAEKNYGDTLMRESTKFKQDGSYVISKRNCKQGRSSVEHYEVIRVDRGYKIKVENPHDAMRNLTDVMTYFTRTSGALATMPLKTNRPVDFGLSDDPYNTGRIQPIDTVADIVAEPPPGVLRMRKSNYEEPVPARPSSLNPKHQTVTPSSAKFNFLASRNSYFTERVPKEFHNRAGKPSMDDIATNIKTAAAMHMLDQTIAPFDERAKEEDYINLKDLQKKELEIPPLPPPAPHIPPAVPPPLPHTARPAKNDLQYVNEQPVEPVQMRHGPTPPPPRQKHERSKSVPNFADQLREVKLTSADNKAGASEVPSLPSRPIPSIPVAKPDPRDGVPTPAQLGLRKTDMTKADPSVGEIMKPTGRQSVVKSQSLDPVSPPVPSPQAMGLRPTKPAVVETSDKPSDTTPEVDQSHPGGVSSIASRFERKASEEKPISSKTNPGAGLKQPPKPITPTNMSKPNYQNVTEWTDQDNPYDDGKTPVSPAPCGRPRSKSTPTISPEITGKLQARLSSDNSFRRKLNDMIGGQANQMSKPVLRRSQTCDDENIYEQLPECDELV